MRANLRVATILTIEVPAWRLSPLFRTVQRCWNSVLMIFRALRQAVYTSPAASSEGAGSLTTAEL
jgi:hypothetical protein